MNTKGIILAGGKGTRLYPITSTVSKQLLPVYDKPMIYYPLSTLMLGGIKDILIISTPQDTPNFKTLLGNGSQWGVNLQYCIQEYPGGLPQAFILGRDFIGDDQVCLILGDNLFYGNLNFFRESISKNTGATIFAYRVENPEDYGVVQFDKNFNVISIEEKPSKPKSNYAIPGLYIFKSDVCDISAGLKPSLRGEVEITDLHKAYLDQGKLMVGVMGRGLAWLDTGSPETLVEASDFIRAIEKRQGMKIACLEEIAAMMNYVDKNVLYTYLETLPKCDYKKYCLRILQDMEN
jgi:glucose-1-phosphate thymidylyltransferase